MPMPRVPHVGRQELVEFPFEHAQVTGDATIKLRDVPAGKTFRLDSVWYNNPTGLAANASNFANLKILKGATIMANWSTETGQQGTLAADTPVNFVNAAGAALVAAGGDVLSLFLDLSGTTTLPIGRGVVRGRYV